LFKEFYLKDPKYKPVFTLKEHDDGELPSMRQLFLSHNDPTGYKFAIEVLGSYEHWKKLCNTSWFQEQLVIWQEELEIKLRSAGLKTIIETADADTAQAFHASKYLADRGWTAKKGRPSKSDITREASQKAEIRERVEEDLTRLRVV
tara:strand:+ start:5396 stop:5836 length:441 start_codon:yes stop_codon:yes gene_type:complete